MKKTDALTPVSGEILFARPAHFFWSAGTFDPLPEASTCEFAFWGRSNVGKSSLLNTLTNQKALCRTSRTPGCTRKLNFFKIERAPFIIVDMPGYGFASVSKSEKSTWKKMIENYLGKRRTLTRLFLLIDSRRGLTPIDVESMDLLGVFAAPYQIVMTKSDMIDTETLNGILEETRARITALPAAHPDILLTSSRRKTGLSEIREEIATLSQEITAVDPTTVSSSETGSYA